VAVHHHDACDWDFTDETGRFDVRLPAGKYVVTSAAYGGWQAELAVPRGCGRILFDIDLP
jgi:hypothetical protein